MSRFGGIVFRNFWGTPLAKNVQRDTFLASCVIEVLVLSILSDPPRRLIFLFGTEFAHILEVSFGTDQ